MLAKLEQFWRTKLEQSWRINKCVFCYAFKTRGWFFVLIPIAFVISLIDYLAGGIRLKALIEIWTVIDPIIGVTTLLIAFSVWRGEVNEDWKNSIPKKLTVVFRYQDKEVMRCNRADLASEADIRQLGQQIGSQMARTRDLKFIAPLVKQVKGEVTFEQDIGFFKDYEVIFVLTELPQGLDANSCLTWEPPFSDKPENSPSTS